MADGVCLLLKQAVDLLTDDEGVRLRFLIVDDGVRGDAEEMIDRCGQIAGVVGMGGRPGGEFIGGAMNHTPGHAAAG